mgnify:CR=1 FL=1
MYVCIPLAMGWIELLPLPNDGHGDIPPLAHVTICNQILNRPREGITATNGACRLAELAWDLDKKL